MSARKVYHVVPDGDRWKVELEGAERASATADRKEDAIQRGKELAKSGKLGQIIIHKQDGTIQTEYTYGEDPRRHKG